MLGGSRGRAVALDPVHLSIFVDPHLLQRGLLFFIVLVVVVASKAAPTTPTFLFFAKILLLASAKQLLGALVMQPSLLPGLLAKHRKLAQHNVRTCAHCSSRTPATRHPLWCTLKTEQLDRISNYITVCDPTSWTLNCRHSPKCSLSLNSRIQI